MISGSPGEGVRKEIQKGGSQAEELTSNSVELSLTGSSTQLGGGSPGDPPWGFSMGALHGVGSGSPGCQGVLHGDPPWRFSTGWCSPGGPPWDHSCGGSPLGPSWECSTNVSVDSLGDCAEFVSELSCREAKKLQVFISQFLSVIV